jgi:hypothetical protein
MSSPHHVVRKHAADFWLARGAILLIAGLQMLFVNSNLVMGPKWLAPAVELAMLLPLSAATAWTQQRASRATEDAHWLLIGRYRKMIRIMALVLTVVVMCINFEALVSVVKALLSTAKGPSGQSLLLDALNIWFTNVVVFALWFWNIDSGGPASRGLSKSAAPDFLFPQMLGEGDGDPGWSPGFIDYFYVSFTNATAFSPTDTMPLSAQSKILMAIEAAVSLLTVGLVAARAVNILA